MKQNASPFPCGSPWASWLAEPLPQRPAGSAGKRGICDLTFTVARGRTCLQHAFVSHPFHLTRPGYLDAGLPEMAVLYVQMPAGGLIQGDRTRLHIALARNSQVHLTTPATEKIHTMTANCAVQEVSIAVAQDAYAEYYPEPIILFPRARLAQIVQVELATGASFFFCEMFIAPTLRTGVPFAGLLNRLHVRANDGGLLFAECSLVLPATHRLQTAGILANAHCWGQAVFVTDQVSPSAACHLHDRLLPTAHVVSGISTLPGNRGLVVKALGCSTRAVRAVLYEAWDYIRTTYRGAPATRFPK
ncbi:MAG: urease accessory protein UreD [Candidatus Binatia bacterium]